MPSKKSILQIKGDAAQYAATQRSLKYLEKHYGAFNRAALAAIDAEERRLRAGGEPDERYVAPRLKSVEDIVAGSDEDTEFDRRARLFESGVLDGVSEATRSWLASAPREVFDEFVASRGVAVSEDDIDATPAENGAEGVAATEENNAVVVVRPDELTVLPREEDELEEALSREDELEELPDDGSAMMSEPHCEHLAVDESGVCRFCGEVVEDE